MIESDEDEASDNEAPIGPHGVMGRVAKKRSPSFILTPSFSPNFLLAVAGLHAKYDGKSPPEAMRQIHAAFLSQWAAQELLPQAYWKADRRDAAIVYSIMADVFETTTATFNFKW